MDNFALKLKRTKKKGKNTPFSVLIVCEGENTEPNYFDYFEKFLNQNFSNEYPNGITFKIFPLSKNEVKLANDDSFIFKREKKVKVPKAPSQIISEDVEEEYKSEPTRWVRYAQKQSINSGYDCIWSVFDYDNRKSSDLKAAFELSKDTSINDQIVDIAFSSYSFEYWILLHYELFVSYLPKSQCKDGMNNIIQCGNNSQIDDCQGTSCLVGYLEVKQYISNIKEKFISFNYTEQELVNACIRAEYVRTINSQSNSFEWNVKPITTVDNLISSLLPKFSKVKWSISRNEIGFTNGTLSCKVENNELITTLIHNGDKTLIILKDNIEIYDSDLNKIGLNNRIIIRGIGEEEFSFDLTHSSNYNFCISIKVESNYFFSML